MSVTKIAALITKEQSDGNWSSFQLAKSTPPQSVIDYAIAPSARMSVGSGVASAPSCRFTVTVSHLRDTNVSLICSSVLVVGASKSRFFFLALCTVFVRPAAVKRKLAKTKNDYTLRQLTWLALDEDHAARSRRVEQLTALRGL